MLGVTSVTISKGVTTVTISKSISLTMPYGFMVSGLGFQFLGFGIEVSL